MDQALTCPKCQNSIDITDFFCGVCGYKLKEELLSTSFLKQLSIYLISFLLPPFGLIPALKYLRQDESQAKWVGIIAIILTLISAIISIWLLQNFMDTFNKVMDSQLGTYENLPF
ncbi:MAG: zinc ribbon domain-containing protein [Candidatus Gottesmanbacteria bacterium]